MTIELASRVPAARAEVVDGEGFVEESTWLRIAFLAPVVRLVVRRIFRHRHARLRAAFCTVT